MAIDRLEPQVSSARNDHGQLRHYHLLAKPAGAACNLGCQYCFFLSKENLYPARESPLMTDGLLETYIRQLMQSSPGPRAGAERALR